MENTNSTKKTTIQGSPVRTVTSRDTIEKTSLMSEDVDFVSDSRAALISKKTPLLNVTLIIIALFLFASIFWASFSEIDELTRGIGRVVPSSKVQLIQNLEGGILTKVFVIEGEIVKKGQPLAQLNSTMFASQYREGYSKWMSLKAKIARLKAQTEGANKGFKRSRSSKA